MNQRISFVTILSLSLLAFVNCKSARQNCYEENRCDSATMECMGIFSMLMNGSGSTYSYSSPGTDGASNGTISQANTLSAYATTVVSGSLSTVSDQFDVYSISSFTPSLSINARLTDTAGSPTCYAYTSLYASSDTSADPKNWADTNITSAGAISAAGLSFTVPYFGYAYIVCQAGSASDNYKLTIRADAGSSSSSSLAMLMCVGAGDSCRSTCNVQYSY